MIGEREHTVTSNGRSNGNDGHEDGSDDSGELHFRGGK